MKDIQNTIEQSAISIVDRERTSWQNTYCFVTDKVAFDMRNLINQLRKNYWGVFNEANDPITQKKKIWIPLTESIVNFVVKNIDLDTKDINVKAKRPSKFVLSKVLRSIIRSALDHMNFGEKLDLLERDIAIDGTKVWKTIDKMDYKSKKRTVQIATPDLLNLYLDPTSESIQEAYRFTERALMTEDEIRGMDWLNTDKVVAKTGLSKNEDILNVSSSTSKYIDVWELWGKIPEYLITGDKKDKKGIDGHIVVSGLDGGEKLVHLIERNIGGKKPYEEAWFEKVSNRWYGRGVAEKVMWLQLWINTIVNIRITREQVSQLGIFKIKRGSGITPQMIGKLAANGAIQVNSQDDIEQFVMQDIPASAFNEEANVYNWAKQVTSTFEAVTGEKLPGETSATAVSSMAIAAGSQFVLIKEGIGHFIRRWLNNQAIPIMMGNIKIEDIITILGEDYELEELDELYVNSLMASQIENANTKGIILDPEQVALDKQSALNKLKKDGGKRFIKLLESIDLNDFDIDVDVTNERSDKAVIMQNLTVALQAAPEYRESILKSLFDLMGLQFKPIKSQPVATPKTPGGPQTDGQAFTQANTMQQ